MTKAKTISDFTPQKMNANLHTQRGLEALEASMNEVGFTAPMVAASDGEIIVGSARLETATEVYGVNAEPIIVESDGTKPIIVVRTDIPNADSRKAKRIGLLDNRVQQIDLNFDPNVLAQLETETPGLLAGLWNENELNRLLGAEAEPIDHEKLWQGMPEFEQEDRKFYHSLRVDFATEQDLAHFAQLIEQTVTEKTKSIRIPPTERADTKMIYYAQGDNDES